MEFENRFWRNTRTEKHRPDPTNTDDPPPAPPQVPPVQSGNVTCGGCGCKLARNGEIISTGERYKSFLKHDQTVEKKDAEIATLTADNTKLKQRITELEGSRPAAASHVVGSKVRT